MHSYYQQTYPFTAPTVGIITPQNINQFDGRFHPTNLPLTVTSANTSGNTFCYFGTSYRHHFAPKGQQSWHLDIGQVRDILQISGGSNSSRFIVVPIRSTSTPFGVQRYYNQQPSPSSSSSSSSAPSGDFVLFSDSDPVHFSDDDPVEFS